jgi:hypothetical protein
LSISRVALPLKTVGTCPREKKKIIVTSKRSHDVVSVAVFLFLLFLKINNTRKRKEKKRIVLITRNRNSINQIAEKEK